MEKATAELDGTLVFNYIVEIDDDGDDEVQIHATLPTGEEPKLDTSFDENQNPKLQSKAAAKETPKKDKDPEVQLAATTAEETPKKDKDLVVLLDYRDLTPKKLLTAVDEDKTSDPAAAAALNDASRETSKLQPLNLIQSSSLRMKRTRSSEVVRDSPKTKRVKTKNVISKILADAVGTKELESPKPKRGRPKSIGTNKLASSASESHSTPKKTEKIILQEKQDAVEEITNLEIRKPMRGRPRKLKKLNSPVRSIDLEPSTFKKAQEIGEDELSNVVSSKDLPLVKPKRGRPKSSGTKKLDVSTVTSLKLFIAEKLKKRGVESKQLKALVDMTQSQLCNVVETNLEAEQQNAMVESTGIDVESTGLNVESTSADVESTSLDPPKPKKGRPRGSKAKKNTVSIGITNLKLSDYQKIETGAKEIGSLVTSDVGNNLDSSKTTTLKALGLEAKQAVASAPQQSTVVDLVEQTLNYARSKYLVPSKVRRGRSKGLKPTLKKKKVTFPLSNQNSEAKQTQLKSTVTDSSKSSIIEATDLVAKQSDVAVTADTAESNLEALKSEKTEDKDMVVTKLDDTVKINKVDPPKSKRGKPKGSVTKKRKQVVSVIDFNCPELREIDITNVKPKQLDAPVNLIDASEHLIDVPVNFTVPDNIDKVEPPKSKRGKVKGSVAKKRKEGASVIDFDCPDVREIDITNVKPKQLVAPVNLIDAAVNPIDASEHLIDVPVNFTVPDNIDKVEPPKSKRGKVKGSVAKKRKEGASIIDFDCPDVREIDITNVKPKQLVAPVNLIDASVHLIDDPVNFTVPDNIDKMEPPKSKRGKLKGSVAKKRKEVASVIDFDCPDVREIDITNVKPKRLNASVSLIDATVTPIDAPVNLKDAPVKLKDAPVNSHTVPQSNLIKTKKVRAKKGIDSVIRTDSLSSKSMGTEKMEIIDLDAPKTKKIKAKFLPPQKEHVSVAAKCLKLIKAKATKDCGSEEKNYDVIETIDLEAPKVKLGKGIEIIKTKAASTARGLNLSKGTGTRSKGVRAKPLVGVKKVALAHPNKPAGYLEDKKQGDIVEIIDLQLPKPKTDRSKKYTLQAKRAKTLVATTELQPSTSKESIETIDLELPKPKKGRKQGLEIKKINLLDKTKDSELPKPEEVNIATVNDKNRSSKHKEIDGKGKRKVESSDGNKDFKFPKPKRAKTLLAKNRVAAFVVTKDTKQTDTENAQPKQDASVGTKDLCPPVSKESDVQSLPRKPMLCTVGTQTLEEEEDILKALEVKTTERQTSVSSVGTQVIEPLKPNESEVKDLGRKISVSSIEVFNLNAPSTAKSAGGRKVVEKGLNASVGKKPFEPALPKGAKASESEDKTEQDDEETFKIEEDDLNGDVIQPIPGTNTLEENTELGVKYETVEQIHTEFKYESQSETEVMMKRRRGKLGGPMRGRRRGPNKMEGQTTIDSFFRIVDLNGKLQMKNRNLIYKCDHCLYVGNSKANLERHSLIHRSADEIMWFHCTECPYKSKYEHQLKSHFLIHMKPDQIHFFHCPHCDIKCSRKHNLTNHIKSIHADRENSFKCAECPYITFSKDRLVAHLRKHSKEVHACTMCKFVTKRQEYLESHFKMKHTAEVPRPYPCDTCSYKGKTKRELDKHYDRMHNKEQLHAYQCNHCSFNSIYKKNLEFHLLHMHNNSEGFQKFICGHCQKSFSYKNGLKVHIIRCHIKLPDDDWHKCMECKYKSKDVSTLKRHIKRNHGAPRLHCKQCSFATNRQTSMDAHLKTHEYDNEDILKCPECPYRIIQMSSFQYHMKVIHGKPITYKEALQYYMQDE